MGDFVYPTNKPYGSSQIASLIKSAFGGNGYNAQQQSALQSAFVGIAGAESSGQTGIVNNTAYANLPGYTSPGPNDTPEFSVGLFQLNLYDQGNYNSAAAALGQPTLGQGQAPSASQANALGSQLAADPQAQAQAASSLFQSSQFQPWTDSYVSGAGGPAALYSSVTGGQAPPSSYPPGTAPGGSDAGMPSSSASSSGSGAINGPCDSTKAVISLPSVAGVGGGSLLNQCQAKHLVGALVLGAGGLVVLVGVALLFEGGKNAIGNGAQTVVNVIPGGVGTSTQAAVTRATSRAGVKQGPTRSQRKGAAEDKEDQLQAAHARGVMAGRSQGRQKNGLKIAGSAPSRGARFDEVGADLARAG